MNTNKWLPNKFIHIYHARLIYTTTKCIDKLTYLLKFKRKLYVPSSKDKFVIGTMTNAMHTMYILTCSVSTKFTRGK